MLVVVLFGRAGIGELPPWARWFGIAPIAAGLALRAWGMRTPGRHHTRTLRTVDTQYVVRSGPYRQVRHLDYAGRPLVRTGYALGLGSRPATLLVAALLPAAHGWRISAEERLLPAAFGPAYAEYRQVSKRLVPFVH
ncbi:protein-S-isoprenylcysteine O-methyltransferase Ste14 [Kitasatospora sp. MAA19]|uniref:methyltransferase family protein n=1 Tax=Kitasatospora sp. MAA19 TaxID=3035090 RepID=UPI002474A50E|nr:isoprenylcysteine carboxylmethyltransferase family protein [Kitasatospora sp. MAA19]MDH6704867.1 protein-S-isoprenylcysteine O-methyltransferase Ste14 [Kitasatospora sp. MAA19]